MRVAVSKKTPLSYFDIVDIVMRCGYNVNFNKLYLKVNNLHFSCHKYRLSNTTPTRPVFWSR